MIAIRRKDRRRGKMRDEVKNVGFYNQKIH